ncbi:MAG: 4-hydroxy-tetrahydrodipicolinate reductase [Chitinophagales bacterium]|nr:4-hydroxy-tetrahydrodipicolinate reductase [Chitinophagales bacterium]
MKIALLGYGKMGKTIEGIISETETPQHEIVLKIDAYNIDELTVGNLAKADVAIEFSTPATAFNNILKCFDAGLPVVVGTTGWLQHLPAAKQLCQEGKGTLFYASNYSIGVNILFEINRQLGALMGKRTEYIPAIHEIHHTEKLDAPSGTAITLANDLLAVLPGKDKWVNHASDYPNELPIFSYREPGVPGTHTVVYDSVEDTIEIKHAAHSRKGFAKGAILAAEWLIGKKGYFEMKDMLALTR